MKTKTADRIWVVLCLALGLSAGANAQSLSNLAGTWNGVYFGTPTQLTTTIVHGQVTDVLESSAFGSGTFQVLVSSNGTFVGDGVGTVSVTGQGAVMVSPDDGAPVSFRVNEAQDVFIGIAHDFNDDDTPVNGLNLVVRAPTSFNSNDVAGTWTLKTLTTPHELIEIFAPTTNSSALTDLLGTDSNSLGSSWFSKAQSGTLTINNDGTFSGAIEEPFTGTYTNLGNGQVHLEFNEFEFALTMFINASKDTMFALNQEPFNRQEAIVVTKHPAAVTLDDLKGVWKVTSYHLPTSIGITRNSSNFITSVSPSSTFDMNQSSFNVAHDGFMIGNFDQLEIGVVSLGGGGALTVTFTNTVNGETETHSCQLNAAKNCLTVLESGGGSTELTMVVKAPAFPNPAGQDYGLVFAGGSVYWMGDTNVVLQSVSSLGGVWTDLLTTQGAHEYQPAMTNTMEFFRAGPVTP